MRWSLPRSTVRAHGFRMLAWIDLEATGLIAAKHAILEVAAIVTDDRLQEVDRFHRVVYWEPAKLLTLLGAAVP